jgi:hypothetical protein
MWLISILLLVSFAQPVPGTPCSTAELVRNEAFFLTVDALSCGLKGGVTCTYAEDGLCHVVSFEAPFRIGNILNPPNVSFPFLVIAKDISFFDVRAIQSVSFPRLVLLRGSLEAADSVVTSYYFPVLGTVEGTLLMHGTVLSQAYNVDLSSLLGVCTEISGSYVDFGRNAKVKMCPTLIDATLCKSRQFPTNFVPPVWGCLNVTR